MPKGTPNLSHEAESAAELRERAARARRLITALILEADQHLLREYAEELEARAADLERGEG
jgi:hypothetical protein